MKIKELIAKLKKVDGNNTAYLDDGEKHFDFTGLSYDDRNDVQLYIAGGDKEA